MQDIMRCNNSSIYNKNTNDNKYSLILKILILILKILILILKILIVILIKIIIIIIR